MGNLGDLRRMFLAEFEPGASRVREQFSRALMEREQLPAATSAAGDYCHRMGGVAGMVGFVLAGEVASLCEGLCKLRERPDNVDVDGLIASALDTLEHFFADERARDAAAAERVPPPSVHARSKRLRR